MESKYSQSGYLMEIPIIMFAVGILMAILLPVLPDVAGKVLLVAGALVWIAGFYYMIVIPGWQPGRGNPSRLGRVLKLIIFLAIAISVSIVVVAYVFHVE